MVELDYVYIDKSLAFSDAAEFCSSEFGSGSQLALANSQESFKLIQEKAVTNLFWLGKKRLLLWDGARCSIDFK